MEIRNDRLRVKVRSTEYTHENLPDDLKPYVEKAIMDLIASGNPTQSRTYEIEDQYGECRMHVYYKPIWSSEIIENEGDAWVGIKPHSYRIHYKKWP